MLFENFVEAESALLWGAFILALIMGAVVNKTNFCTMGAVSDLVNMNDTGRMRAWLFAIAIAVLGVAVLEYGGLVEASATFPPYRGGNLLLAENILGGLMFGIGMTLASGCGNKTLIRIGGGNLKSIVVFAIIAFIVLLRVFSIVWAILKLYDFRLTRHGDRLRATYGLLTRISKTILIGTPCSRASSAAWLSSRSTRASR